MEGVRALGGQKKVIDNEQATNNIATFDKFIIELQASLTR